MTPTVTNVVDQVADAVITQAPHPLLVFVLISPFNLDAMKRIWGSVSLLSLLATLYLLVADTSDINGICPIVSLHHILLN